MNFVKAFYVDAKDGIPATVAPTRHGPKLPHNNLIVDAVDRRANPAFIIGRLPKVITKAKGVSVISQDEYEQLLSSYNLWREELAAQQKQREIEQCEESRRVAYATRVDPLAIESVVKQAMGFEDEAQALLQEAVLERLAIQAEYPWPNEDQSI